MSKKRDHHEPFCHNCHADLLQYSSVQTYMDTNDLVLGYLIPGEENTFDFVVDSTEAETIALVNPAALELECRNCCATVIHVEIREVYYDRDFNDLKVLD